MKDLGRVQGSGDQALPLIIGKDTVYVHTDIEKVETDPNGEKVENLYAYNEIQYGKDEYIQLLSEENARQDEELTNTQLALCDVYEMLS